MNKIVVEKAIMSGKVLLTYQTTKYAQEHSSYITRAQAKCLRDQLIKVLEKNHAFKME